MDYLEGWVSSPAVKMPNLLPNSEYSSGFRGVERFFRSGKINPNDLPSRKRSHIPPRGFPPEHHRLTSSGDRGYVIVPWSVDFLSMDPINTKESNHNHSHLFDRNPFMIGKIFGFKILINGSMLVCTKRWLRDAHSDHSLPLSDDTSWLLNVIKEHPILSLSLCWEMASVAFNFQFPSMLPGSLAHLSQAYYNWAMKNGPLVGWRVYVGYEQLPSYVGIIVNHCM